MTQQTTGPKHPQVEPLQALDEPSAELLRGAELSQLEAVPPEIKRAIALRLRQTVNEEAAGFRRPSRVRTGLLALGFWVVVPSAFAATPMGSAWVERALQWAPRVLEFVGARASSAPRANQEIASGDVPNAGAASEMAQSEVVPGQGQAPAVNDVEFAAGRGTDGRGASVPGVAASAVVEAVVPGQPMAPAAAANATPPVGPQVGGVAAATASNRASNLASRNGRSETRGASDASPRSEAAPSSVSWTDTFEQEPLNAERRLLQSARLQLRAGDARGALELTARHAREFPSGMLTAERNAIIQQAQQLERR